MELTDQRVVRDAGLIWDAQQHLNNNPRTKGQRICDVLVTGNSGGNAIRPSCTPLLNLSMAFISTT